MPVAAERIRVKWAYSGGSQRGFDPGNFRQYTVVYVDNGAVFRRCKKMLGRSCNTLLAQTATLHRILLKR